eukprot:TRINITY_DN1456_c0_g1_i1.p1 TRINITY_DN1456_c0_g1~~TRINITY_DN1456_c0_g1_i1.p1  ORF type:complete len:490 (-),score=58.79 TRINITY_DN1456_c0_g1_i1:52-1521(-)
MRNLMFRWLQPPMMSTFEKIFFFFLFSVSCTFFSHSRLREGPSEPSIQDLTSIPSEPQRPDIILFNIWYGKSPPPYLSQFLETVTRNNLSFLLVASTNTPSLCPYDNSTFSPSFFPTSNPNIQLKCYTTPYFYSNFARGMCAEWGCTSKQLFKVYTSLTKKMTMNGYFMNDLKPVYPSAFGHLFSTLFPHKNFKFWVRTDIDLFLSEFDKIFPWDFTNHDILTFTVGRTADWRELFFRGSFTAFRISKEINRLWLGIPSFENPETFLQKINPTLDYTFAIDEGAFSKHIILNTNVSFAIFPGLQMTCTTLNPLTEKIVVRGGNDTQIFKLPTKGVENEAEVFQQASAQLPKWNETIAYLGEVNITSNCAFMYWIPADQTACVDDVSFERINPLVSQTNQVMVYRSPGKGVVEASLIKSLKRVEVGEVVVERGLYFHFIRSKKRILYGEYILQQGDKMEVGKTQDNDYWARYTFHNTPIPVSAGYVNITM